MSRRLCILEVYFRAIEGALEQLRHLFRRDASRVGTRAGVADGVCRNRVQFLKELVFLHAEFLNRLWNVHGTVEGFNLFNQRVYLRLFGSAAKTDPSRDVGIPSHRLRLVRVVLDDVRQVNGVRAAVRDVAGREGGSRLVRHGVHDAEQRVRERLAGQTLCVMHLLPRVQILIVGRRQVIKHHLDGLDGQRVRERAVQGGNVCLDGVRQSVHAGIGNLLDGKALYQCRVDDGHVRRDFKVGQRILDALGVVRDDGKCRHFRRRAGRGRDGAEAGLRPQFREIERRAQILERRLGILVERPHGLGRVNRGTAANGHDPIRLEICHGLCALHDRLYRRIRLDTLEKRDFHAGFLQVTFRLVQKAALPHGATARYDDGLLTWKVL